jgi:hypothetical protein
MDGEWNERPGGGLIPPAKEMAALNMIVGLQAPGAIPNGRRVRKVNSRPKDATPEGTEGTVLGSVGGAEPVILENDVIHYGYVIEWDNFPTLPGHDKTAVFITSSRVEEL